MTDVELLSARLLKLETQYRRIKRTGLFAAILIAAGAVMAQNRGAIPGEVLPNGAIRMPQETRPPVSQVVEQQVRAHQFILVDDSGKERASLVADGAGSVFLVLFDKNEKSRANLSVSPDGPSLVFYDPSGQARAVVGSTTLVASHVNENGVVEKAPPSSIVLFDRAGKLLFRTP